MMYESDESESASNSATFIIMAVFTLRLVEIRNIFLHS